MVEPAGGRGSVLVVGSINVDLVVRIAHLPVAGETVTGGSFARHPGGKGANQAVAAARLGAGVVFVGAVGDDELGRDAVADLAREGVDASRVQVVPGVSTGVALIVVDERGENQIVVASGANARVDAEAVHRALEDVPELRANKGSIFLANLEISDDALIAGAGLCARAGMQVIINPAPARQLPAELVTLRPILLPNLVEAEALTAEHDPQAAARVLAARSGAPVIVTLGAAGALLVDDGAFELISAPLVEAVDTTGAGDTFAGALAAEIARGSSLLEAARFAVRAASLSVTVAGARGGMPSRADVDAAAV